MVAVLRLSLVAVSGGDSLVVVLGLSLGWFFLLQSMGSVIVAHGLSCSMACEIFLDEGLNWCPLRQKADSSSLNHQGSPVGTDFSAASSGLGKKTPQQRARGNQGLRRGKTAHIPIAWK